MAFAQSGSAQLYYQIEPAALDQAAPWLMFCNSLGTTHEMWQPQLAVLGARYRILRYDRRGHGRSTAPPGLYSLEMLAQDALAVMDAAGVDRAHFCGLSMGGLVGQWLALNAPQRLRRLVLCSTAAKIGTPETWRSRIELVQREGLTSVVESTLRRWFTPAFIERDAATVDAVRSQILSASAAGYAACCNALIDADFRAELRRISLPVLTISGSADATTLPSDLRAIAEGVRDGRSVELAGAHLCNIESAETFNAAVTAFLAEAD